MLHAHFAAFCRFFPTKTGRGALFFTGHTRQTTQQSRENLRGIEGGGIQISPAYKSRNPRSTPKKTARAHLLTTFTGGARAASGGEPGSESAIIHLRREKGSRRHESGLVSASSLESDEISWRGLKRLYEASRSSKMDKRTEYRTEERRLIKFHDGFNLHQIGL